MAFYHLVWLAVLVYWEDVLVNHLSKMNLQSAVGLRWLLRALVQGSIRMVPLCEWGLTCSGMGLQLEELLGRRVAHRLLVMDRLREWLSETLAVEPSSIAGGQHDFVCLGVAGALVMAVDESFSPFNCFMVLFVRDI